MDARLQLRGAPHTILLDLDAWGSADELEQDRAIEAAGNLLGPAFRWLGTEPYACREQRFRIATFRHERSGAELNLIPGGRYEMGHDQRSSEESPRHEVRVRPFLIGRSPLTQECWDMVGGRDERPWQELELPICGVSWNDAQDWLARAGDGLRLPSEAEWEYASRAGTDADYFWGPEMDPSYCWYGGNAYTSFRAHPPWEHEDKPNAFGLIDILGNVFEWCEDDWIADYRDGPFDERPRANGCGHRGLRVIRGGSWNDHCDHCCTWFRFKALPSDPHPDFGLRLACTLPL